MACRHQLVLLVLISCVLATSALRGALYRNGRSFLRNQTPMSVEEPVEEPAKRAGPSILVAPSSALRERLMMRQLLQEIANRGIY